MKRKGGEERGRKRVDWTGEGAFAAMGALQGIARFTNTKWSVRVWPEPR